MMTDATQFAVFYSTASKILRRKVIPDRDAQLAAHLPGPGESRLLLPLAQPSDDDACRAAIAAATGVAPPSGRCAVVDGGGDVVEVCNADPELDAHPLGALVASDLAGPGDRCVGGRFLRRYAVVDTVTNRVTALTFLPLANPASPEGGRLAPAGSWQIGDVVPAQRAVLA